MQNGNYKTCREIPLSTKSTHTEKEKVLQWLREVRDPEIPVLNVIEMGIVRDVFMDESQITVFITPTYSGCPAMNAIEQNIKQKLLQKGVKNATVKKDFSASWTTDWMTDEARRKLKEYGIAPPEHRAQINADQPLEDKTIECPHCHSENTRLQSEFGSTACKAQFYCHNCEQAFEHFKCH